MTMMILFSTIKNSFILFSLWRCRHFGFIFTLLFGSLRRGSQMWWQLLSLTVPCLVKVWLFRKYLICALHHFTWIWGKSINHRLTSTELIYIYATWSMASEGENECKNGKNSIFLHIHNRYNNLSIANIDEHLLNIWEEKLKIDKFFNKSAFAYKSCLSCSSGFVSSSLSVSPRRISPNNRRAEKEKKILIN